MDEKTREQKSLELADVYRRITALQDRAAELERELADQPGEVREFRPRPSNGGPHPTDQGSC